MIVRTGGVRARDDSGVLGDAAHGRGGQLGQADGATAHKIAACGLSPGCVRIQTTASRGLRLLLDSSGCVLMVLVVQSNVLKDGSWVGARDGRIIRAEGMIEG